MNEKNNFALVPKPANAIEKADSGTKRIFSVMVADTLALKRSEAKFRIGEYEWREPDYLQILLWSRALELKPEEVIERLVKGHPQPIDPTERLLRSIFGETTTITNGSFEKIFWHLDLLPLKRFEWIEGLSVTELNVKAVPNAVEEVDLNLKLQSLTELNCVGIGLSNLDLSNVPNLRSLACGGNKLRQLDLKQVPHLNTLNCSRNDLAELGLACAPNLKKLNCSENPLDTIDLNGLPELGRLNCSQNRLTTLDFSMNKNLTRLHCQNNQISRLNLSDVPNLGWLKCFSNNILELDIRSSHSLWCLLYDAHKTHLIENLNQTTEFHGFSENWVVAGAKYYAGHGVPKDFGEAVKWYCKAAEQNNADAQFHMGLCYANGHGVEKNNAEAVKWYRKAAEQNNAMAQNNLGVCYKKGHGVPVDLAEAYKFYKLAAEQKREVAIENLKLIVPRMSAVEIVEGERSYREFKSRKNVSNKDQIAKP